MLKNDDICSMTKSEERAFEILKSQLDTEKRERLAEQKKRRAAEVRLEEYEKDLSELRRQLTSKIDDQSAMLSQLTQFLMGNGAVSLSDSLKDPIIGSIREEFEKRERVLKEANEKRIQEMLDAFNRKLAAKDNEINRLKGRKNGKPSGNDGNMTGSTKINKDDMTAEDKLKQSEQQKANVQTTAYGQHTECTRYNHGCQQTEDADTMDLNGETVPDEMISNIANRIREKKDMKGVSTPRREQPLAEISKGSENEITLTPENVPADAEELKPDVTVRYSWIEGYIRVTRIVRRKFKDNAGKYYFVNLPKEYHNGLGRTQITESLMAKILIMHFVYDITISDIESWLKEHGLNYAHTTVIGWFRLASKIISPLDEPLRKAITDSGNIHSDETTIKCQDQRLPGKGEKEEDVDPEEHYFKRWMFCHHAPGPNLTQFDFFERGRRTREAEQAYLRDVTGKLYVHSDGAQLYKCYDIGELIIRIACLVHIRRPLFKLKDYYKEAAELTEIINLIFELDRKIKLVSQDFEYIRLQRVLQISPLFNDFKSKLEVLSAELDPKKEPELLKAVNYALKELPCMLRCLESGELDLSDNVCERQIRRITKYRNNSFFVGSPEAGMDFARLQSLFANIKNHTLNGMEYICDIFRRIKDTSEEEMENLLAHKWQPSRIVSNQF